MKIGYPCVNTSIGCSANKTFRLSSYSPALLKEKIKGNLDCLFKILEYNKKKNLLFFRMGSGLVPFASHPICRFNWRDYFKNDFAKLGDYIRKNGFRISAHPGHFVLIDSPRREIVRRSVKDLIYHCQVFDLMKLDYQHKIQVHVGGTYGDKEKAAARFASNFKKLPGFVKKRLVIENDEKNYSVRDCLQISRKTKIPVLLDVFHNQILNNGESIGAVFDLVCRTWEKEDGLPMLDYSSQARGKRIGAHCASINLRHFRKTIQALKGRDFDLMLEIKDKEKSALRALRAIDKLFSL